MCKMETDMRKDCDQQLGNVCIRREKQKMEIKDKTLHVSLLNLQATKCGSLNS